MTGPALALVRHLIARPGEALPPLAGLYDYVLGAGGLYLRAVREGISVQMQIASCPVRGLAEVEPHAQFTLARVPATLTAEMLEQARDERDEHGRPREVLYHLWFEAGAWQLIKPEQTQGRTFVHPADEQSGTSYGRYLIEVHSHHELAFDRFSSVDDASERGKFRLFGLLSNIYRAPTLRLRLNVYDFSLDVPAAFAFEMPEGLAEAGPDSDLRLIAGALPLEEAPEQPAPLRPDFAMIDALLAVLGQGRRG